jgi:hypothetical protein
LQQASAYHLLMAMEYTVQRLQIGDVILADFDDAEQKVEATVVRDVERTEETVRVTLRAAGRDDFVEEWPLGKLVTVVRGP